MTGSHKEVKTHLAYRNTMLQRLSEIQENSKKWWNANTDSIFVVVAVFLAVLLAGGGLRLFLLWQVRSPITLREGGAKEVVLEEDLTETYMAASGLPGLVAASRNGTRYYYPWCGGLNRVKEANKIWFDSEEAAEAAGYIIASGCEGL